MPQSQTVPVILYRYQASPYSTKIDNVLILKGIAYSQVDVAPALPRPEITDFLGVTYRRIPILAIGNDIYCDTRQDAVCEHLIVTALERHFPAAHYGTIFPKAKVTGKIDSGLAQALSHYGESAIFPPAVTLLPWDKMPASFVQDRSLLSGAPINPASIIASRGVSLSTLSSHLQLLEEQLSDGREWLLNTEQPSLVDLSFHFIFTWLRQFPAGRPLFETGEFPHVNNWLAHFSSVLESRRQEQRPPPLISGQEAAQIIVSSHSEPLNNVGFDSLEASRLGVRENDIVSVAPVDTGRNYPTVGNLVALGKRELVVEVKGSHGVARCHFPRLGFSLKPAAKSQL
ncbi:hypothetical protein AMATHDRAFT_8132 [Amanita thiersii Skay4041]|uniref:GST N-terminal domain-containing protein n=1 Tax=Amanita thiersii Skay4041 TaxID=703135 RepID=A0A2A9NEM0_9AGAR|nr:hypothetical protein AMATHDRAFT_8132 [Amanita thiersii Skay4041]